MVLWLGLRTSNAGAQVRFLVRELRSCKLRGTAKKKKERKKKKRKERISKIRGMAPSPGLGIPRPLCPPHYACLKIPFIVRHSGSQLRQVSIDRLLRSGQEGGDQICLAQKEVP